MGLETLFSWIIDKIEQLVPVRWVRPWEGGVRVHGSRFREVGPGFHLVVPFFGEVTKINVKQQTVDCDTQEVRSASGTTWRVSISITYEVHRVANALVNVQDYETSLIVEAMNFVARWINLANDDDISIVSICEACYPEVRREGFKWGCAVQRIGINSLSHIRMYRVVTNAN